MAEKLAAERAHKNARAVNLSLCWRQSIQCPRRHGNAKSQADAMAHGVLDVERLDSAFRRLLDKYGTRLVHADRFLAQAYVDAFGRRDGLERLLACLDPSVPIDRSEPGAMLATQPLEERRSFRGGNFPYAHVANCRKRHAGSTPGMLRAPRSSIRTSRATSTTSGGGSS